MTPAAPIRTALLGFGRVAELFHLRILARLDGVQVGAVAEADPARRGAACAHAPGAALIADYREILADPAIDAVVICLPTGLHAEAASAAFEAGKHVYLEKPIAADLAGGRRVVDAWRASGAVGTMGFNQRFDPVILGLRQGLDQGRAGTVVGARILLGSAVRNLPGWKRRRATGGGVLLDLGSHAADLARFLFDQEIGRVSGTLFSARTEEDTASLAMTLSDGRIVHAELSSAASQESRCEVFGDGGSLVADRYAGTLQLRPPRPPYGRVERVRRGVAGLRSVPSALGRIVRPPRDARSYRAALAAFAEAARTGRRVAPDMEDGWRSLAVVIAAEESARSGRHVEPGMPSG